MRLLTRARHSVPRVCTSVLFIYISTSALLCVTFFKNSITGLLDVARRTYTDIIDDIAGLLFTCGALPLLLYFMKTPHTQFLCQTLIYSVINHFGRAQTSERLEL